MPPREDLRLLSLFHYVLAGLTGLCSCFPLSYVGLGVALAMGRLGESGPNAPPVFMGWLFAGIGGVMLVLVLAYAAGLVVAGRSIARRRNWLYCMIVAGLSCASFPFGTALGVFTLVVLSKPEVKALFTAPRVGQG